MNIAGHCATGIGLESIFRQGGGRCGIRIQSPDLAATRHGQDAVRTIATDAGLIRCSHGHRQRRSHQRIHDIATIIQYGLANTRPGRFTHDHTRWKAAYGCIALLGHSISRSAHTTRQTSQTRSHRQTLE
jgi:hypothetical protein